MPYCRPSRAGATGLPSADFDPRRGDNALTIATRTPLQDLELLSVWARTNHVELTDLEVSRPTLEDIYLRLTSRTRKEP